MSPTTTPILEMPKEKGEIANVLGRWSPAFSEEDDLDAVPSGYNGPLISMFGHRKGLGSANKMQDLNFCSTIGSRIGSEM